MKKIFLCIAVSVLMCGQAFSQSWPEEKAEAKAGVRWWWLGSAVNEQQLRQSLQEYARAGIGSVEITPIYGVQGNAQNEILYLSVPWMKMLQVVEDEGQRDGILVDMNNGTGWPFGGPTTPVSEAACKAVFLIDTVATGAKPVKTINPREQAFTTLACERRYALPDGKEQVIRLFIGRTLQKVKRAALGGEGYVIDHFDKTAVQHYLERFEKAFAETQTPYPHNFFNDSYEVYHANWTPTLLDEFARRRGYRLEEHLRELLGLIDDGNQVLSDYRETLSDMLLENFSQQWTAWAHSHGVQTRNQAHGSPANLIDVYASVDVPEIEGFGLSDFGIKGLRTDPGMTRKNFSDVSMLKYAASAAHITGKPLTSSETFTWLTEHFRTSLSQMKPDLDLMFTCGVNHMFFHGTCYSPQDDPWPGWKFYASIDMSPTNSIWRDAPFLMDYIERCQRVLQAGQPDNDFLVYLPVRDMWKKRLKPGAEGLLMQFDIHTMDEKAPEFISSILKIDSLGYDCDYISDRLLEKVVIDNGQLKTEGGTTYKALIIPTGTTIHPQLAAQLQRLSPYVIYGERADEMAHFARPEAMKRDYGLRLIRRKNNDGHHYFIANLTPHDVCAYIPLSVEATKANWLQPLDGSISTADIKGGRIFVNMKSGESRILRTSTLNPQPSTRSLAPSFSTLPLSHWVLSFQEEKPKVTKTFRLKELVGWETLDDDSVKVTMGTGVYTTTVKLTAQQAACNWFIDLGDVRESARVYINDTFIGCAWAVPFVLDCQHLLHKGKNKIRIEVTNLPANRIAHLDRLGYKWRKFNEINVVDITYKNTTYENWAPMPSGLNSEVRLICQSESDILDAARKTNDYFMQKYSDPTEDTFVRNKKRPSSLWTRAVYYEGLMALYRIDPQQRYLDYTHRWADFHQWTPRHGIQTTHADDQCCEQTYIEYFLLNGQGSLAPTQENLAKQMATGRVDYWTWIDAIQMAMPVYIKMYALTQDRQYLDYAMKSYNWTRNECGGGLFNTQEGLWWRDKDYVPPYKEVDGKNCYWSRGNGWVYAALVRCLSLLPKDSQEYQALKKDFIMMSEALLKCQHDDGFWRASLVSSVTYPDPEMTGTSLFLYGMAWGIQNGLLKEKKYRPACDLAWKALKTCVHANGFLAWNQGTGKDPSAGQPVTYDSVPDFEDYGTGCFLLGLTEYFKLVNR